MKSVLITSILIILYTYIGYGLILFVLMIIKKIFFRQKQAGVFTPTLTIIVTAYNEISCIEEKISNTLSLDYPQEQKKIIFITDGSNDGTVEAVQQFPQIKLLHQAERNGKIAAIHRAMQEVQTEIVVLTDANTMLNKEALTNIARHYSDEKTGAVSGEKRVDISHSNDATAGEGFYWKYESLLKYFESEVYTIAGAAGELYSMRTRLYEPVAADTILDDFQLSMKLAAKGYKVKYEPNAWATEPASPTLAEERKRKTRIAAGDIQAMLRLPFIKLLFTRPFLWFAYTSHRLLRWIVTPYLLIVVFVTNLFLYQVQDTHIASLLYAQLFFYFFAFAGWVLRKQKMRPRFFFLPYYFCLMNYGLIEGLFRYVFKGQSVNWEKAERMVRKT